MKDQKIKSLFQILKETGESTLSLWKSPTRLALAAGILYCFFSLNNCSRDEKPKTEEKTLESFLTDTKFKNPVEHLEKNAFLSHGTNYVMIGNEKELIASSDDKNGYPVISYIENVSRDSVNIAYATFNPGSGEPLALTLTIKNHKGTTKYSMSVEFGMGLHTNQALAYAWLYKIMDKYIDMFPDGKFKKLAKRIKEKCEKTDLHNLETLSDIDEGNRRAATEGPGKASAFFKAILESADKFYGMGKTYP